MYETCGVINYELLNRIKKYFQSKKMYKSTKLGIYLAVFIIILSIFRNDYYVVIFGIALEIFFILYYFFVPSLLCKKTFQRIKESSSKGEISLKVLFDEGGVEINNLDTGGKQHLAYDVFERIAEVEDAFVIFTKANQFVVVFKNSLESMEISEFRRFIQRKCTNLKEISFL